MATPNPRTINNSYGFKLECSPGKNSGVAFVGNGTTGLIVVGNVHDAPWLGRWDFSEPTTGEKISFLYEGKTPGSFVGYDSGGYGLVFGKSFAEATAFKIDGARERIYTIDCKQAVVNDSGIGLTLGAVSDGVWLFCS